MALRAGYVRVPSRERIICVKCVIEFSVQPVGRRVTGAAIVGQAELHVRGVVAGCEVAGMAAIACRGSPRKYVIGVARRAWLRGMRAG